MSTDQQAPVHEHQQAYPTMRPGGLFVAALGAITVASAILGPTQSPPVVMSPLFFAGLFLAAAVFPFLRRRLSTGPLTLSQQQALRNAFLVEGVGLAAALAASHSLTPRTMWLWVLFFVGAHFMPLRRVHGPAMAALSVVSMACAGTGLVLHSVPFQWLALVDGVAKLLTGAFLFADGTRRAALNTAQARSTNLP